MSGNRLCDIAIASGNVAPVQRFIATLACSTTIASASCAPEPSQAVQQLEAPPLAAETAPLPDPLSPAADALSALAKRYAAGLIAEGPVLEGDLAQGERRDHLLVLTPGHCYRVIGAGEASLQDLDLALFDPTGAPVTEDPGQDRYPVIGVQGGVCPSQAGSFRLQAHAYLGQGKYSLRLYRTAQ